MIFVSDENIRLDLFLARECEVSRSNIKNAVEENGAFVNGVLKKKSGYELKAGDKVEFELPPPSDINVEPAAIPLKIIFQDDWLAVIDKPKGMIVHPASSYRNNDTLVNALLYNLDNLSSINGVIRPGIVHRLDKDTSGLIVVAKNDMAHKSLAAQIENKSARRIYWAIVDGNVREDEGTINAPIARSRRDRKKMAVEENGRRAVTHYRVLERFGAYTLMRFELETGRTHQIRVHAAYIHHPVTGDKIYGGSTSIYKNGQLLHARELVLVHPSTGQQMHFTSEVPEDFASVIRKLRISSD